MIPHYSTRSDTLEHSSVFSLRITHIFLLLINKSLYEESHFLILITMGEFIQKNYS